MLLGNKVGIGRHKVLEEGGDGDDGPTKEGETPPLLLEFPRHGEAYWTKREEGEEQECVQRWGMAIDHIAAIDESIGYHVEHQQRSYADQLDYDVKLREKRNKSSAKPYVNKRNTLIYLFNFLHTVFPLFFLLFLLKMIKAHLILVW